MIIALIITNHETWNIMDNKIDRSGSRSPKPTVRKLPADTVPYGTDISRNGKHVWCAYDGETLIAVGPTADEARAKYREALRRKEGEGRVKS
jgi:hypothetical protein